MLCVVFLLIITCEAITDEQFASLTDAVTGLQTDLKVRILQQCNYYLKSFVANLLAVNILSNDSIIVIIFQLNYNTKFVFYYTIILSNLKF